MREQVADDRTYLPLRAVRVIDFTHLLAGPYCTMLMADAGADVINIEPPWGQLTRIRGARRTGSDGDAVSSYAAAVLRGKRSVTLDLKTEQGVGQARALVQTADVVVENLAPGALARLGLDLGEIRAAQPGVVTASISLFGASTGCESYSQRRGIQIIAEAESGLLSNNRAPDGTPHLLGGAIGDFATGMACFAAIVTALYDRAATGEGRHIDMSMVGTLLSFNSLALTGHQMASDAAAAPRTAAAAVFATKDGHVTIGVNSDRLWRRLSAAMERPDLADDERFCTYRERDQRAEEVDGIVSAWTESLASSEVMSRLGGADVPCGRVNTPAEILGGDIGGILGFVEPVGDGLGGRIGVPRNPLGFRGTSASIPPCGKHTEAVLEELPPESLGGLTTPSTAGGGA